LTSILADRGFDPRERRVILSLAAIQATRLAQGGDRRQPEPALRSLSHRRWASSELDQPRRAPRPYVIPEPPLPTTGQHAGRIRAAYRWPRSASNG
jgi:hypothetical protein